jgi:hypothetical protein
MKRLFRYAIAVLVLAACVGYWQSRSMGHALDASPYGSYNPYSTSPVSSAGM